jgi:hypothetical protein
MKYLVNPVLVSRLLIVSLVASGAVFGYRAVRFPDVHVPLLYGLARWDSQYYIGIAANGFNSFANHQAYAFRPLYPWILHALYPTFLNGSTDTSSAIVIAGFLWNLFAIGLAAFYLEKLTSILLGSKVANRTLLLLAVYPSTFFLSAIYPEATAILLIASSLYYLETSNYPIAAALGFLAGLVRPETFLLGIPFIIKAFLDNTQRLWKLISGIIVFMSLPVFGLFSYLQTGNALVSLQIENSWPKCTVLCFMSNPVYTMIVNWTLPYVINIATMILTVAFIIIVLVRKNSPRTFPYYLWTFILLTFFFYYGDVRSWARFALVLPPVFWAQVEYSLDRPRFFQALVILYAAMMSLSTILFVNWYPFL